MEPRTGEPTGIMDSTNHRQLPTPCIQLRLCEILDLANQDGGSHVPATRAEPFKTGGIPFISCGDFLILSMYARDSGH